jgi:hypothetical protein
MAGFEVVVRPVVFPNIRPQPTRSLPPADNPDQGFAVIRGNGAKALTLTDSWSTSMSTSRQVETERRVDEARVYQMDDKKKVNRKNFVDIEIANRIKMRGGAGFSVADPLGTDPATLKAAQKRNEEVIQYYQRQVEQINIEIKKRDQIRKNEEAKGE